MSGPASSSDIGSQGHEHGPVLVTGGAGYVGSFAVRALLAAGERVVVLDDLSLGHRDAVPEQVPLFEISIRDVGAVSAVLASDDFDAVMHFAASAYVGESVREPRMYWENNVGSALSLFGACIEHGVKRVVHSSTCAVYGEPQGDGPLSEDLPFAPVSPYGRTKGRDRAHADRLRGARPAELPAALLQRGGGVSGRVARRLGEDHDPETHLIPLALHAAATGTTLRIFGTDWPTPDGTCVRDYVHVEDLAAAHVAALTRLRGGATGMALNLGTGRGTSVREVADAVASVTGLELTTEEAPRQPGDPAVLVAVPGGAETELGFAPLRTEIEQIVRSAWAWHGPRLEA